MFWVLSPLQAVAFIAVHQGLMGVYLGCPDLRSAQPIVEDFCARHAIPYSKAGMRASYGEVLRHLHDAGAPLRHPASPLLSSSRGTDRLRSAGSG